MSLYHELKRRNVFRVTIAYVIIAWLILQVGDTLAPALHLPESINTVLAFFLILGFPLAIFLAWAYELTPEGLKKERDVDRSKSITHVTGRKLDSFIIAVLVLALGYFVFDKFVLGPSRDAELVQATTEAVTEQATEPGKEKTADKSIAVLPFVNMSDDASNEYFSDGISEELLNLLAKIPELRVIARTSSFAYKGKNVKIADMARELNVNHVLEGSVRKSGNQVRITAQLIHAADSSHLWSESYDRALDDIFIIQNEIAAAVVEQLKVTLLGAAPAARETDPAAYTLVLQADYMAIQGTPETMEQSIALYQQALEIAPDYAVGWTDLAAIYTVQGSFGLRPFNEASMLAREAANKALAINPAKASALAILGQIAMEHDRDLAAAARHIEHALALEPTRPYVLLVASNLARILGRPIDAIALLEYVIARDPVYPPSHAYLGQAYIWARRPDEAIASFRTAVRLSPGFLLGQFGIGWGLVMKGEFEAALVAMQAESSEAHRLIGLAIVHHALGQAAESDAVLVELIEKYEQGWAYNVARVLAYRGETDRSFEWLDKAVQYKDSGLVEVATGIGFANIHNDPRWLPFLEHIGKSPEQLAAIEFKVTLPE